MRIVLSRAGAGRAGGGHAAGVADRAAPRAATRRRTGYAAADRQPYRGWRPERAGRHARRRYRQHAVRAAQHARAAGGDRLGHQRVERVDPARVGRDRPGQYRSVAAHRRAGRLARRNRVEHGAADRDRAAERRQRAAGERRRAWRIGGGGARQRSGGRRGRDDARTGGGLEAHDRHHRGDRRHRLPDQHSRAQRGGRSGARGRAGPRLCGGGGRSALARAAQRGVGQGDQGADRKFDRRASAAAQRSPSEPGRRWPKSPRR